MLANALTVYNWDLIVISKPNSISDTILTNTTPYHKRPYTATNRNSITIGIIFLLVGGYNKT